MPPPSPQPLPYFCTQPYGVALSGSYAFVTGAYSSSLAVIDVGTMTRPVASYVDTCIVGSVSNYSVMNNVRPGPGRVPARAP